MVELYFEAIAPFAEVTCHSFLVSLPRGLQPEPATVEAQMSTPTDKRRLEEPSKLMRVSSLVEARMFNMTSQQMP